MKNIIGQFTAEMDFISSKADGICKCCKKKIKGKHYNSLLCGECEGYIKKITNKYNHRINRHKKLMSEYKILGSLGRIKQKNRAYEDSKKKIKNLKNRVRYYEKKYRSVIKKRN